MSNQRKHSLLTEVELEFMNGLWSIGSGSVRDILAQLPEGRNPAYTTGATIMRILENKGFVTSTKQGKTLVYTPTLEKDAYEVRSLRDLSQRLFDNTPARMVARLVDDAGLTQEALEEIRALVERRLRDGPD